MTIKQSFLLSAALAAVSLGTPFVWLKIGPNGYAYYGINAPDIYIFGATIIGKDRDFSGINFAYKFQFILILYFLLSNLWVVIRFNIKIRDILILNRINLLLLFLFPIWMWLYTDGVIANSDNADLTAYPHVGVIVYLLLAVLNIRTFKKIMSTLASNSSLAKAEL